MGNREEENNGIKKRRRRKEGRLIEIDKEEKAKKK